MNVPCTACEIAGQPPRKSKSDGKWPNLSSAPKLGQNFLRKWLRAILANVKGCQRARLMREVGASGIASRSFNRKCAKNVFFWLTERGVITTSIEQYGAMSKEEITPVSPEDVERGESAVNYTGTASVLLTGQVQRLVTCVVC